MITVIMRFGGLTAAFNRVGSYVYILFAGLDPGIALMRHLFKVDWERRDENGEVRPMRKHI